MTASDHYICDTEQDFSIFGSTSSPY